jgi:hypothetical protein
VFGNKLLHAQFTCEADSANKYYPMILSSFTLLNVNNKYHRVCDTGIYNIIGDKYYVVIIYRRYYTKLQLTDVITQLF